MEPTERARVSSGTFVRGSSQRASWRLVPSFTQQIKEARETANASEEAETGKEAAPANEDSNEQVEGAQESEQISFKSDENQESTASDRNVTLVAHDFEDEDATLEEPVTMTFTIGSRGNQEAPSSNTLEKSNDEQRLEGQGEQALVGEETTSMTPTARHEETIADEANEVDESSMNMDQPTTPILSEQH